jgi:hypothetical protein
MDISDESKQRLIRFANAVREYEFTHRKIHYSDGSYLDLGPSGPSITERAAAKADLLNCPEPEIQAFVYQIDIKRLDEAMADESKTALDVVRAAHDAQLSENELVYLGHKFKTEQARESKRRSCRRREHGRRNSRTARRS